MEWPPLQGQEVALLREHYASPLQLRASFDSEAEASDLINLYWPGIGTDGVKERVKILLQWSSDTERAVKRRRREILREALETLTTRPVRPDLAESFDQSTRENPLVLLEGMARRKKAMSGDADPTQRAAEERTAREKYALLLAGFVKEAKLPVVDQLQGVSDPDSAWKRLFGSRRSKTLRNRFKSWSHFRMWLQCTQGLVWPTKLIHLLDYSNERFSDGCGKTVLDSFQAALAVLEQTGKVPEPERFSRDNTWLAQLSSLTADLKAASPPTKQAPMISTAMIVSLELHVVKKDETPFERALAWVALVAVFASMRIDDLQGVIPKSMTLTDAGFRAVLGRTKTTGSDRRHHEVPIFIQRNTSLAGVAWLEEGFKLWKTFETTRDFLVPIWSSDRSAPTKHYAKPALVSTYIRDVYRKLYTPKLDSGKFRPNTSRLLMVDNAAAFFTGHSPRNWMPSVAAALGYRSDERDFLGRWLIGGAGAAEYTRTARQVVHNMQVAACKAVACSIGGTYSEEEPLLALKDYVDQRGGSGALARRRHDIQVTIGGVKSLGLSWPVFQAPLASTAFDDEDECPEVVPSKPSKYFISVSRKTGHRRLHINGPCHVKPYHCHTVRYVDRVDMQDLDSICRDCKHRLKADRGQQEGQASTSESASSSDSEN